MSISEPWRKYACDDYFREGWSSRGHFDELSQTWVIVPIVGAYEDAESEFFAVGRSGCGVVDFGDRKGRPELWAYYPIEREFKYMAATVAMLVEGWCSGRLNVLPPHQSTAADVGTTN
jgi:hypothetical protein